MKRLSFWIKSCLLLINTQNAYSHQIGTPNASTWDQLSYPIRDSRHDYVCPVLDPNNASDVAGKHSHIFAYRAYGYCFFRHYITPQWHQSGPLSSTNNNGVSGDCPNNLTANPINIATGNKFFIHEDFVGQGINPLKLTFFYNSNSNRETWSVVYTQKIIPSINEVSAKRGDGRVLQFQINDGVISGQSHYSEHLVLVDEKYELRLSNGVVEHYNRVGKLLSINYPSGITHTLTYSGPYIFIKRLNDTLTLEVDDNKVVQAILPNNARIQYDYSTSVQYDSYINSYGLIDKLTKVIYPDGAMRRYLYGIFTKQEHLITGILDENGNRISSVEYDTQGRAISSEVGELGSGINRTEIEYHDDGTRTVTNSLGKKNKYHFTQFNGEYKMTLVEGEASANCAAANQAYTYDANGFMASKTDWQGNITTYIHNDRGLETSRTEASGTPQARTITTEWHPTFNLRTKVSEPQRDTVFYYDDQGRLTSQEVTPR